MYSDEGKAVPLTELETENTGCEVCIKHRGRYGDIALRHIKIGGDCDRCQGWLCHAVEGAGVNTTQFGNFTGASRGPCFLHACKFPTADIPIL